MVRIKGAYSIKNLQFSSLNEIENNPSLLKLREFTKTHTLTCYFSYDISSCVYICCYEVSDKTVEKARKTVDEFEMLISKFNFEFLGETQTEYLLRRNNGDISQNKNTI